MEQPELKCPQCLRPIALDDSVVLARDGRLSHFDCRMPRALSGDEWNALIFYCFDHAIVECVRCAWSFRAIELSTDYLSGRKQLCPRCRADLTDNIRAHLDACTMLPAEVRRRAQETRETARRLVKQSRQLRDRADVLAREAEAAMAALRESMRQSVSEARRRLIQRKLRDGSLPHEDIPATISGGPGDGSRCGACDQVLTIDGLMMIPLTGVRGAKPIALHADCFELWNEERRSFTSNS